MTPAQYAELRREVWDHFRARVRNTWTPPEGVTGGQIEEAMALLGLKRDDLGEPIPNVD